MTGGGGMGRFLGRQFLDALGGVALTAVLFALVEGGLWLAGAGAPGVEDDLSLARGFDPKAPYLVPDPQVPGGWLTQLGHGVPRLTIPPRGKRPRVLLFGGSNTQGFPGGILARELRRAAGRPFEVINLGRKGYGSERVTIIFRQALERLDPDVAVVYTGHNEFVERGFAMDLEAAWGSAWVREVAQWLGGTRTGRTLAGLSAGASRSAATPRHDKPEEWLSEYKKFARLRYPQTLRFWDEYERNLRTLCTLAHQRGVHLVLATVVYNRFSAPRVSTVGLDLSAPDVAELMRRRRRAARSYPDLFQVLVPRREILRVHGFDWDGAEERLVEGEVQEPLPGLRPSLGRLAGRDPLFPVDRPWQPKVRELYRALGELHAGVGEEGRAPLEQAREELAAALATAPQHPATLYEWALASYYLGRRDAAVVAAFEDAARFDRAPRKGNGESNDRVRRVAADFEGVLLMDADRLFAEGSPDGLVGWEWMKDHCHLTPGGARVLMEELAGAIVGAWYREGPR